MKIKINTNDKLKIMKKLKKKFNKKIKLKKI